MPRFLRPARRPRAAAIGNLRTLAAGILLLLAQGCGGGEPHSDYFILAFRAGTTEPTTEGALALKGAEAAARSSHSYIVITAATSPDPANEAAVALSRQRAGEVAGALVKAGARSEEVRTNLIAVGEAEFQGRKDTLIVQVVYDARPPA